MRIRTPLIGAMALLIATPAMAAPWVRGYVVDYYEPAFYYGGKTGTADPGSDCPKGTNPDTNYKVLLKTRWRNDAQLTELAAPMTVNPKNPGPSRELQAAFATRGFRPAIDTYVNPFAAPDPGMQQVAGSIAYGFNLDGNARTGGFNSPEGERGIDNQFYRIFGCYQAWRGAPFRSYESLRIIDHMRDGMFTVVIRISGNQSPLNDSDALVEIAASPDRPAKDPLGGVLADYSFRPIKDRRYTLMKAKIHNRVVETAPVDELHLTEFAYTESQREDAVLYKGRMRLTMTADGNLSGLVGGYRDWVHLYELDVFNQPIAAGFAREAYFHTNEIALYYALKRYADAMPDPKTGRNRAISVAYRFTARPGYVVDSNRAAKLEEPPLDNDVVVLRALSTRAILTRQIVDAPHEQNPRFGKRTPFPPGWDVPAPGTPTVPEVADTLLNGTAPKPKVSPRAGLATLAANPD